MRLLWDTSSTQTLKQWLLLCESPSTQRHPPKSDRLCLYPSLTLAFRESLLVSLSGEVMWGTSWGPYLSRPVILILPWLLGCQEFQAGRQSGLGEYCSGRVSWARALWGPWESQSCANSWKQNSGAIWDVTEQWEIHLWPWSTFDLNSHESDFVAS